MVDSQTKKWYNNDEHMECSNLTTRAKAQKGN